MEEPGVGPRQPRALVLQTEDRNIVIKRLARGLLRFQDLFLERETSPAGLLCQVWMPEVSPEGEVTLRTKGMPFCVAGLGDLLALFRCISCRFAFGTDVKKVSQLGAPGRVFTSSEPELACNVQKYSKTAYLRKAEAEQCQVQSTLLLPVFLTPARHGCVGVLEVVQTSEDMHFTEMGDLIGSVLEKCQLYTSMRGSIDRQLLRATTTATVVLPASVDILRAPQQATSDDSAGERANSTEDGVPMADVRILQQAATAGSGRGTGGGGAAAVCEPTAAAAPAGGGGGSADEDEEIGEAGESGDEEDLPMAAGGAGAAKSEGGGTHSKGGPGGRRRGKGSGNPGKPGVRLKLEDLQSQFGVGLKEAAARLGICPTTLKRACRRHGIQRWPRRQLQKVNQVLDQMDAQGGPLALLQQQQAQQAALQQATQLGALGSLPAADTRWTALAQFIPAFQNTMQYSDNLLPFGGPQPTITMGQGGANPLGLPAAAGLQGGGLNGTGLSNGGLNGPLVGGLNGTLGGSLNGAGLGGWANGGGSSSALPGLGLPGGGAGPGGSFVPGVAGLPQFAELQTEPASGRLGAQQQQQQQAGPRGPGDGAVGLRGPGMPGLPPGVLAMPQGPGGPTTSAGQSLFGLSEGGPAFSGISSFGQPPPGGDGGDAAAVPVQRAQQAFRQGLPRPQAAGGGPGLAGGTPAPLGMLPNMPGLNNRSWQLPGTPLGGNMPLEFDLAKAGALAEGDLRDDDVGFLDPTVLELLLQEDANKNGGQAGQAPNPALAAGAEEPNRGMGSILGSLKLR